MDDGMEIESVLVSVLGMGIISVLGMGIGSVLGSGIGFLEPVGREEGIGVTDIGAGEFASAVFKV